MQSVVSAPKAGHLGNGNSEQGASDGLVNLDESSGEEEPETELLAGMSSPSLTTPSTRMPIPFHVSYSIHLIWYGTGTGASTGPHCALSYHTRRFLFFFGLSVRIDKDRTTE